VYFNGQEVRLRVGHVQDQVNSATPEVIVQNRPKKCSLPIKFGSNCQAQTTFGFFPSKFEILSKIKCTDEMGSIQKVA